MAADLRKCCSEDNLPTAPWQFLLSFLPFLVLLYSFSKVRISPKVTIACNSFCLLRQTKAWLACDIISYSSTIVCTLLHRELRDYSLGQIAFVCTLLHRELRDYSLGQIAFVFFDYHTAALPCKRIVNMRKHNYYVSACNILCAC